ncbi:MAG: TraM recognition domain-containing protein, partial [Vulcanimicrobiaceae bacterium]
VIDPFVSNLDLCQAFATDSDFDLSCLERGEVVILEVDLSKFGATAKLVYLLAREQLKRLMLDREHRAERGDDVNCVLYLQDEYASYAGKNDTELLRLCRAAKIAPVMLYQSQSILEQEISKEAARAIVGAVSNKLIFRTDDYPTVELLIQGLGQTNVEFESYS